MSKLVFNANAPLHCGTQVSSLYQLFEREKLCKYDLHIRQVEMGSFTPLVFNICWYRLIVLLLLYLQKTCLPSLSSKGVILCHSCVVGLVILCYDLLLCACEELDHCPFSLRILDLALADSCSLFIYSFFIKICVYIVTLNYKKIHANTINNIGPLHKCTPSPMNLI